MRKKKLKKSHLLFKKVCVGGIALAGAATIIPAGYVKTVNASELNGTTSFYQANNGLEDTPANWMGVHALDEQKVGELSIPGTHDSTAYVVNDWWSIVVKGWAQTQDRDITKQLEAGVRYFDFRTSVDFKMYHGITNVGTDLKSHFTEIKNFLDAHPKEFVVVRLKNEKGDRVQLAARLARELFEHTHNPLQPYFARNVDFSRTTVGELRKKIVIINDVGENLTINAPWWQLVPGQDNYEPESADAKWEAIKVGLQGRNENTSHMFVNHVSYTQMPKWVSTLAYDMNERLYNHLESNHNGIKNVGVLAMDFPSDKLIKEILLRNNLNFKYQPTTEELVINKRDNITADDIRNKVKIPRRLISHIEVETLPNTNYALRTKVKASVVYKDGTKDDVYVPVTINETDADDRREINLEVFNYDASTPREKGSLRTTVPYRVPKIELTLAEKLSFNKKTGTDYQNARNKISKAFMINTYDISKISNIESITGKELIDKAKSEAIEPKQEYASILKEPEEIFVVNFEVKVVSYSLDSNKIITYAPVDIVVPNDINNNNIADEEELATVQNELAQLKEEINEANRKKEEIEADNIISQREYDELHRINEEIKAKQEALLEKANSLPNLPQKNSVISEIEEITVSNVVVNDADNNGKNDATEQEEEKLKEAINTAINNLNKAISDAEEKKTEILKDGIVSKEEKEELDKLVSIVEDTKIIANQLINSLENGEEKTRLEETVRKDETFEVTLNDANNNGIKDVEEVATIKEKIAEVEKIIQDMNNLIANNTGTTEAITNQVNTANATIEEKKNEIKALIEALPDTQPEKETLKTTVEAINEIALPDETVNRKEQLKDFVRQEELVKESENYKWSSEDKKQAFDNAINAAKELLKKDVVSIEEEQNAKLLINAANTALNGDRNKADAKEILRNTILLGNSAKREEEYLNATNKEELEAALNNAKEVFKNANASLQELQEANQRLSDEIRRIGNKKTDYSKLIEEVAKEEGVKSSVAYRLAKDAKRTKYDEVLEEGKKALKNKGLSQDQVNVLVYSISLARTELDGKETDTAGENTENQGGTENPTNPSNPTDDNTDNAGGSTENQGGSEESTKPTNPADDITDNGSGSTGNQGGTTKPIEPSNPTDDVTGNGAGTTENQGGTENPTNPSNPKDDNTDNGAGNTGNQGGTTTPTEPSNPTNDNTNNGAGTTENQGGTENPTNPSNPKDDNTDNGAGNTGNQGGTTSPTEPSNPKDDNTDNVSGITENQAGTHNPTKPTNPTDENTDNGGGSTENQGGTTKPTDPINPKDEETEKSENNTENPIKDESKGQEENSFINDISHSSNGTNNSQIANVEKNSKEVPQTSDKREITIFTSVAVMSAFGLIYLNIKKKKS